MCPLTEEDQYSSLGRFWIRASGATRRGGGQSCTSVCGLTAAAERFARAYRARVARPCDRECLHGKRESASHVLIRAARPGRATTTMLRDAFPPDT